MSAELSDLLAESRQLGFLGPGPVGSHVAHAKAFAAAATSVQGRALDLGAGGGVPGLVLAATTWPTTHWRLLDARARCTLFLERAIVQLDLEERVEVVSGRAEETGRDGRHRGRYDLVVARSFGPSAVTAECAAPLVRLGGHLVVSEPPAADASQRWPEDRLAELGFGPANPLVIGVDRPREDASVVVHLVVLELIGNVPDRYPRRVGVPAKRPLF
ncbi:hypothetical protein BH20ACT3_BH20ACT3_02750 [soil metagenome]